MLAATGRMWHEFEIELSESIKNEIEYMLKNKNDVFVLVFTAGVCEKFIKRTEYIISMICDIGESNQYGEWENGIEQKYIF